MFQYVIAYIATAVVFLGVDFLWLSRIAKSFYYGRLGDILLETPRMGAAVAFYAAYVVGIVLFAIAPALRADSAGTAFLYGALFGLFAYGTYDMTNYATLRHWSLTVSLVDMAWGAFLTGLSALIGMWVARAVSG
ncbi:DUF2177 family protein [Breoghania sp. JC706]|uniref:DUF2177 family protein n=1 Tax=Breoghania sp. JC706 TaxID=3117732 RepID=UPI003008B952